MNWVSSSRACSITVWFQRTRIPQEHGVYLLPLKVCPLRGNVLNWLKIQKTLLIFKLKSVFDSFMHLFYFSCVIISAACNVLCDRADVVGTLLPSILVCVGPIILSEMVVESESHWKAARIIRSLSGWVGRKLSPNNPSFPSSSSAPLTWDRSLRNSSICTESGENI